MNQPIGFIGLGQMGQNIVLHLVEQNIDVVAYNRTPGVMEAREHLRIAPTITELAAKLPAPRVIWLMISAGAPVDEVIEELVAAGITTGDTIIDGGNSNWHDSVRREKSLSAKSIRFIDCGTSGGLEGARTGACLMLGGEEEAVTKLSWLWETMAVKDGWKYFGPSGAGHFIKMVHNGIEYGMDEAIGEGFELLEKSPYKLDLALVAATWVKGSIVRGYLIELLARALATDPHLDTFTGKIGSGETGTWTLAAARELGVEAKVIEKAVEMRILSRDTPTFSGKVVSALRKAYGGHKEAP